MCSPINLESYVTMYVLVFVLFFVAPAGYNMMAHQCIKYCYQRGPKKTAVVKIR